MIQTSPTMRVLVAIEPVDFRKGIDGLGALCRQTLQQDPMSGCAFVFRNRTGTSIKVLVYDGQGFWLCQKRLSQGRFPWWPTSGNGVSHSLDPYRLHVLLAGGNADAAEGVPIWRPVNVPL